MTYIVWYFLIYESCEKNIFFFIVYSQKLCSDPKYQSCRQPAITNRKKNTSFKNEWPIFFDLHYLTFLIWNFLKCGYGGGVGVGWESQKKNAGFGRIFSANRRLFLKYQYCFLMFLFLGMTYLFSSESSKFIHLKFYQWCAGILQTVQISLDKNQTTCF